MRLSAAYGDGYCYRVYDYQSGEFRKDLVWVDDSVHMVGVGFASGGREWVFKVEYRKRVLIITALKWIALDLPEEAERIEKKISIPELFRSKVPEYVVVR